MAFSRVRKLTFTTVFIIILQNSVKSLQLILNEFVLDMNKHFSITAGAFTRARKKLKHTAYIELNNDIIDIYYENDDIKRLRGYRLLALDGSKLTLPKNEAIRKEFGSKAYGNQGKKGMGEYSRATFQGCYDVLNNVAVQSILGHGSAYECDLAKQMLPMLDDKDLLIFDRAYAAFAFIADLVEHKRNFIIRCPKISFAAVQRMFDVDAPDSLVTTIDAPAKYKKAVKLSKLPNTLTVRLVKVILPTGEIEVLATSLLNENEFANDEFMYLYSLRWGVETYFSKLKGRLSLENFTGKTVESIYQDFWSTIFISNLETIMIEDLEAEINDNKPDNLKKVKINKAVSYNAIKKMAFKIFFDEPDRNKILDKLTSLFSMNTVTVRKNRPVQRKKISGTQSLNFQKRVRKHVF